MQLLTTDPATYAVPNGRSDLRDSYRRSLMRMIFAATAVVLAVFAVLQILHGNIYLALVEVIGVVALTTGALRIKKLRNLRLWSYAYLILVFSFMVLVMAVPGSSDTAFVWVSMMPVLSYLLLGRKRGFLIAVPFMSAAAIYSFIQLGSSDSARSAIELFNPILCGLVILLFIHIYETLRFEAGRQSAPLAGTDAETGLADRSSFHSTFERTVNESGRSGNSFALILIDIDNLQDITVSLGQDAGAQALRHVAQSLIQRLRSTDVIGRLDQGRFGLILRDMESDSARRLIHELRQRLADNKIRRGGETIRLTVTLGPAIWPHDAQTATALYQSAHRRLHADKYSGRDNAAVAADHS